MKDKLTIEESAKLLKYGIPKKYATGKETCVSGGYYPVFTFTDLMNLVKKNYVNGDINYHFSLSIYDKSGKFWFADYYNDKHSCFFFSHTNVAEEMIDAVYQFIISCLKTGIIYFDNRPIVQSKSAEDFVDIKIAEKLKTLGFDWPCNHTINQHNKMVYEFIEGSYHKSPYKDFNFNPVDEIVDIDGDNSLKSLAAPTLYVAAKWLRDVKYYTVDIAYDHLNKAWNYFVKNLKDDTNKPVAFEIGFYSYDEALRKGIGKTVDVLIENSDSLEE